MLLLFKSTELGSFITSNQEFPNQAIWYTGCDQISSLISQHCSHQPQTSDLLKSRSCSLICPGFHTQRDFCTSYPPLSPLSGNDQFIFQNQFSRHLPRKHSAPDPIDGPPFGIVYWPCFLPRAALVTACSIFSHSWKEHCHHCHQARSSFAWSQPRSRD